MRKSRRGGHSLIPITPIVMVAIVFGLGCPASHSGRPTDGWTPLEVSTTLPAGGATEVDSYPRLTIADDIREAHPGLDLGELNGLLGTVYFDFDRAELRPDARLALERNAGYLRDRPSAEVLIEGHCDERGTNEYNLALGHRRATIARDYLIRLGIEPDRLRAISYGEERSLCYESGEDCWTRNRRAFFRPTGS